MFRTNHTVMSHTVVENDLMLMMLLLDDEPVSHAIRLCFHCDVGVQFY